MLLQFAWKEYRSVRAVWLWVSGLTLLALAAIRWLDLSASAALCYQMGWLGATLMGLAAPATLLAGERETGTWNIYHRWPVSPPQVWTIKVVTVLVTQAALLAVTAVFCSALTKGARLPWDEFRGVVLCVPEALAWGMLSASLIARPLTAATAGGVTMVGLYTTLTFITPVIEPQIGSPELTWSEFLDHWWALRAGLAVVALGASLLIVGWPRLYGRKGD